MHLDLPASSRQVEDVISGSSRSEGQEIGLVIDISVLSFDFKRSVATEAAIQSQSLMHSDSPFSSTLVVDGTGSLILGSLQPVPLII